MAYGDLSLDAPSKPNKGMEDGACNRRTCQAEPACFYNYGSYRWYCSDCANDIGNDVVNKRDWDLNWKPKLGHDQFLTRAQMEALPTKTGFYDYGDKTPMEVVLQDEMPLEAFRRLINDRPVHQQNFDRVIQLEMGVALHIEIQKPLTKRQKRRLKGR